MGGKPALTRAHAHPPALLPRIPSLPCLPRRAAAPELLRPLVRGPHWAVNRTVSRHAKQHSEEHWAEL